MARHQDERSGFRRQVAEAIRTLDTAIQFGADPYVCYLRQARLYQTRQQLTEAVSAAEKAIAAFNGKEVGGRALTVNEARPMVKKDFTSRAGRNNRW